MKLLTFRRNQGRAVSLGAIIDDKTVLDLVAADGRNPAFMDMLTFIRAGGCDHARALIDGARRGALDEALVALADITLLAPIPRPPKNVFCVGRNYLDHVSEGYAARGREMQLPEYPQFFTKPPTAVVGHGGLIPRHSEITEKLDYEVELGIVIGTGGRDIAAADWRKHVFGYTIVNDITARDLQQRHDQWFKGKGLDGSCPMGPWIVTDDAINDPQNLNLSLSVNGEIRQKANTAQMIFALPRIIADLSRGMTLEPGDIIATGTPSGVGYAMKPPRLLSSGDVVTCTIEGIGTLQNRVA